MICNVLCLFSLISVFCQQEIDEGMACLLGKKINDPKVIYFVYNIVGLDTDYVYSGFISNNRGFQLTLNYDFLSNEWR